MDVPRSADPPIKEKILGAIDDNIFPEACRVAIGPSSGRNSGRESLHTSGKGSFIICSQDLALSGYSLAYLLKTEFHSASSLSPFSLDLRNRLRTPFGI